MLLPLLLTTVTMTTPPEQRTPPREADRTLSLVLDENVTLTQEGGAWRLDGAVYVLRGGEPTTDAVVLLNGQRLAAKGTSFPLRASPASPGMKLALSGKSGGDAATLEVACPSDLQLLSPAPGASVRPGETLHLSWKPTAPALTGVYAYFRGSGSDTTTGSAAPGATSLEVDVPATARGPSTLMLTAKGPFADHVHPSNRCRLVRALALNVDGAPIPKPSKPGVPDPPDFIGSPQKPWLPLEPATPVVGEGKGRVLAARQANPVSVAADDAAVYWTNADHHTHASLVRQPQEGPPQLLRREAKHRYYGLQARGGFLYFLDETFFRFEGRSGDGQALLRLPSTGGAAEEVLPRQPLAGFSAGPEGLVATTALCRFMGRDVPGGDDRGAGCAKEKLLFLPRGGAPVTLAEGLPPVTGLALSRGNVFFASGRTVWRVPVAGGRPVALYRVAGIPMSLAISPNGLRLAWAEWQFPRSFDLTVFAADLAGEAPPRRLAEVSWNAGTLQSAPLLAIDEESAFVASARVGQLLRVPLSGGSVDVLASQQLTEGSDASGPGALALSGRRLLWTNCHQSETNTGWTWWGRRPPSPPAATVNALDL